MPNEAIHWYRSKVDWWIGLLLCVAPGVPLAICVVFLVQGRTDGLWTAGYALSIVGVIYIALVYPMRYGLDEKLLHVQHGLAGEQIPLVSILQVYPTRNPRGSPALSLNRLHIQFGPGTFDAILISPTERERFLDELAAKAGLRREGDRLLRV